MKLNKKGFTLIELLMTIIIISVVAFIAVSAINFSIKGARKKNKENEDEVLKSAVSLHVTYHQMANDNNNIDYSTLCKEEPVVKNDSCTNVKWCKISIESMVNSGAIDSFPSDVKNEDGSVAYTNNSYVYAAFVDDSLYSELMVIDPGDDYTYNCPAKKEPQVEDDGDSVIPTPPVFDQVNDLKNEYNIDDSLIAWYDGYYNQRGLNDHSEIVSTWHDLVGYENSYKDLSFDTLTTKPVWGDNYLKFSSSSTDYLSTNFSLADAINDESGNTGFTIYSVFENKGSSSVQNYAWGLTDSDNNLILANGHSSSTTNIKFAFEVPGAVIGSTPSQTVASATNKIIVSAIVVSPSSETVSAGWPKATINTYIDDLPNKKKYTGTSAGSLKSMIYQVQGTSDKPISKLYIGGISGLSAKKYDTYVYSFLIYKKALTADDIESLFTFDSQRFSS